MEKEALRILLVEDEADHAALIQRHLKAGRRSIVIEWVGLAAEALTRLGEHKFDAVLLDMQLPDSESPTRLLERITRACDGCAVVVLTSLDDESLAIKSVQQGAQDYLVKSRVDTDTLLRSLRYAIERKKAEDGLREGEIRLKLALDASKAGFWDIHFAPAGHDRPRLVYISPRQKEIIGFADHELPSTLKAWEERILPEDLPRLRHEVRTHLRGATQFFETEYRVRHKSGQVRWVHVRGNLLRDGRGRRLRWTGIIWDITDQKRTAEVQARLAAIAESSDDAIIGMNPEGVITDWNNGAETIYGYTASEAIGKDAAMLVPPEILPEFQRVLERLRGGKRMRQVQTRHRRKGGETFHVSLTAAPIIDSGGRVVGLSAIVRDVTEWKAIEQRLHHDAFHDKLTGLPNRALFVDRLEHLLARAERNHERYAVIILDLDNFKVINDSLGHLAGDRLLVEFAQRLQTCLRPVDTLARFGGDEFTILLEEVEGVEAVERVVTRINEIMAQPFLIEGREIYSGTSIGITMSDNGYRYGEAALRDADTALYIAKRRGKRCHVMFDKQMRRDAMARLKLETDLRSAVYDNQIEVHYQPIIAVANDSVCGCEALARWRHPDFGTVMPDDFIPLAEETGLILALGRSVLDSVCARLAAWRDQGWVDQSFYVSVNLSAKEFINPTLSEEILALLEQHGIPGRSLRLEITESVLIENDWNVAKVVKALRAQGIRICVDDFGTGYSSLASLHRFPVDVLKVDRAFVNELNSRPVIREILNNMVSLARNLRMEAVAEGAESREHLEELKSLGFHWVQGHCYYRAMEAGAMTELLRSRPPGATQCAPM